MDLFPWLNKTAVSKMVLSVTIKRKFIDSCPEAYQNE